MCLNCICYEFTELMLTSYTLKMKYFLYVWNIIYIIKYNNYTENLKIILYSVFKI